MLYFGFNGFRKSRVVVFLFVGLGAVALLAGNSVARAEGDCDPNAAQNECSEAGLGETLYCHNGDVWSKNGVGYCHPIDKDCRNRWENKALDTPCSCGCQAIGGGAQCTSPCPTAVCGNGTKEGDEECDDGNTTSGDGCSSSCKNETACTALISTSSDLQLLKA